MGDRAAGARIAATNEPLVCSIGTTEPWNVAGLGLDIRALAACGARAVSIVAAVSAQDGRGALEIAPIAPRMIDAPFAALARAPVSAYRIGALASAEAVASVVAGLRRRSSGGSVPIVYDPVLATSAGGTLASETTIAAIARELLPLVTVVTPNLAEAERLARTTGAAGDGAWPPDRTQAMAMSRWGRALVAAGAGAALVTGGHLAGDPVDVYVDAFGERSYADTRLPGDLRGTGCLLACALAAELARGAAMHDAISRARAFVRTRFATPVRIGDTDAGY
ncbi:MAG: bifunctional hydroxymethylpyrimidine kinase/phosphomethylpyrimidine kinase [Vulcanimicrobiaceae bacterium]